MMKYRERLPALWSRATLCSGLSCRSVTSMSAPVQQPMAALRRTPRLPSLSMLRGRTAGARLHAGRPSMRAGVRGSAPGKPLAPLRARRRLIERHSCAAPCVQGYSPLCGCGHQNTERPQHVASRALTYKRTVERIAEWVYESPACRLRQRGGTAACRIRACGEGIMTYLLSSFCGRWRRVLSDQSTSVLTLCM